MISVVNGFVCTSSCDVDKAKRGIDPHPKPGEEADGPLARTGNAASTDPRQRADDARGIDQAAVVFGGSLSTAIAPASASVAATPAAQRRADLEQQARGLGRNLDILV